MKRRLHPLVLASALTLLAGLPLAALADDTEARLATAREVVALMNEYTGPEKMVGVMKGAMRAPMEQQLRSASHLSMAQRDRAAEVLSGAMSDSLAEIKGRLMPEMNAAMTRLYVERFTLDELRAVRDFYASPAGRKSMTVVVQDLPQLMQPMMQGLQAETPKLQARVQQAVRQLAEEGIALEPPPAR